MFRFLHTVGETHYKNLKKRVSDKISREYEAQTSSLSVVFPGSRD
jgi:hypothetical protein